MYQPGISTFLEKRRKKEEEEIIWNVIITSKEDNMWHGNEVLQFDGCSSVAKGKLAVSHWEAVCGIYNHNTAWAKIPTVHYGQLPAQVTFQGTADSSLSVPGVSQASPLAPGAFGWHTWAMSHKGSSQWDSDKVPAWYDVAAICVTGK